MKNFLRVAALILLSSLPAFAQHKVTLSCTASVSVVSGYNVYRSVNNGASFVKINTSLIVPCAYVDTTVTGGTKYQYAMTAVDSTGVESVFSNIVLATIPEAPPGQLNGTVAEIIVDNDECL